MIYTKHNSEKIIIALLVLLSVVSCKKQKDVCISVTNNFIQGKWLDYGNQMWGFAGRTYNITFNADSFYLSKSEYSDAVSVICNSGGWDIYAKGKFEKNNNGLLILEGYYCDENYNRLMQPTCIERIDTGNFYREFNKVYYCNDTLVLQNTEISDWHGLIKLKRE